jgi:hypothetical protein
MNVLCFNRKKSNKNPLSIVHKRKGERLPNMGKKWSNDEVDLLKRLFDEGVPDEEIARMLGRTTNSIGVKRFKTGITDIHKRRFTQEGKRKLIDTRKQITKEKHPMWKGGRRVSAHGYIEIHLPGHHRARKNGYVFEHILVAEKKIGRQLAPGEDVHHINKNKQDNSPGNLDVLSKSDHSALHGAEKEKTGEIITCSVCGKEFYSKPSHVKRRVTCSMSCHAKRTNFGKNREIKIPFNELIKAIETSKNKQEAARKLGISYCCLMRKLKRGDVS